MVGVILFKKCLLGSREVSRKVCVSGPRIDNWPEVHIRSSENLDGRAGEFASVVEIHGVLAQGRSRNYSEIAS
jgi:hypothetical protein